MTAQEYRVRLMARVAEIKAEQAERVTLIDQLRTALVDRESRIASLETLRDRLQARLAIGTWAEDDIGFSYSVGNRRRHLLKYFDCKKAHTKSLLRSPINTEFWEGVSIDE